MAEKITVAELDINTEAFIKEATNTKAVIDSLKNANTQLKKSGEQSSEQFVKNEVAIKRLSTKYTEQKNVLVSLNSINTDFISTEKAITKAVDKNNLTIQEARNNNKELLKVRNQLNLSNKKGRDALVKINSKLDQNNKFIKDNASGYEKQKISIGNYEGALRSVFPQMSGVLNVLKSTKDALVLQKEATIASTTATNLSSKSLRIFKIALISTGIGAIVVALGSLVAFLTSTQKGIDAVTAVTRPLQAVFQSLLGVVQVLGEEMFDAFTNPKEAVADLWEFIKTNFMNRIEGMGDVFKSLGKIISSGFTDGYEDLANATLKVTTGVDDLIGKTRDYASDTAEFFKDAAEKGAEIDRLTKQIEQSEAELVLKRSDSAKQLRELQLIANDRSKTSKENNDAAEKAIVIANDLANAEKKNINDKIKREEIQQSLNDSGRKDLKALNTLKAEANAADEKARSTELKFLTAKSNLIKQQQAEAKKQSEAKKKQDEQDAKDKEDREALELEKLKTFEQRKRDLLNEIALENAATEEEKATLKAEQDFEKQVLSLENLKLNKEQETELLALMESQQGEILNDIKEEVRQKNIDAIIDANKKEIDASSKLTESDKKNAQIRTSIASTLTGALMGLLGDSLGAKIASIAIEAGIQSGLVAIDGAAAGGKITAGIASANAAAIAASPLTLGQPFVGLNTAQGIKLQTTNAAGTTAAISKILAGAALKSVGALASGAFYEGGKVPTGTGGQITGQNIPTQKGGDNIFATVKSGEVILNEEQQSRAGGNAFFRSIGVPGFANGGITAPPAQPITPNSIAAGIDMNAIIDSIQNKTHIVAIVDDIDSGLTQKTEIIQGANI